MTDPTRPDPSEAPEPAASDPARAGEHPDEPGAYIGHEPERAADTIPGGVGRDDERISATATQSSGVGRPDERGQPAEEPSGHRQGAKVSDDDVREAGEDR